MGLERGEKTSSGSLELANESINNTVLLFPSTWGPTRIGAGAARAFIEHSLGLMPAHPYSSRFDAPAPALALAPIRSFYNSSLAGFWTGSASVRNHLGSRDQ